jgi:NDP-sugar pyrophosphorylase family protein
MAQPKRTKCVLLAAGLGTRLRPLTDRVPKCLVEIAGKPLLDYWIDGLERAGVRDVLVNTHHLPELVRAHLAELREQRGFAITEAYEPKLLGSAGTIAANREFSADADQCLIVYADNLSDLDLGALLRFHVGHGDPFTMALFRTTRPKECGIAALDSDARIVDFTEKPAEPTSDLANAGVYVLTADAYREIADLGVFDFGFDVIPRFVGRMRGFLHAGYHLDIGHLDALERARKDAPRVFGAPL